MTASESANHQVNDNRDILPPSRHRARGEDAFVRGEAVLSAGGDRAATFSAGSSNFVAVFLRERSPLCENEA
jgi:hypothetical protein